MIIFSISFFIFLHSFLIPHFFSLIPHFSSLIPHFSFLIHSLFSSFLAYHSAKDSLDPSGMSRCLYHGFNLLFTTKGIFCKTHLPALPMVLKLPGDDKVHAIAFMPSAFVFAAYPSLTIS